MAKKNRIYIVPRSGKNEGKMLVFDYVESMDHSKSATVASHSVESQNQNIADHRYSGSKVINLTGMFSDKWNTEHILDPTPVFRTAQAKLQERLRIKCVTAAEDYHSELEDIAIAFSETIPAFDAGTDITNKIVNGVLDGEGSSEGYSTTTLTGAAENASEGIFKSKLVPKELEHFIAAAERLVAMEIDILDIIRDKGMSLANANTNGPQREAINEIGKAIEFLSDLDKDSTLVNIHSIFGVHENMVLTSHGNPLRNGAQRGAYWVSLTFQEERIAEDSEKFVVASYTNSEAVNKEEKGGKRTAPEADKKDTVVSNIHDIYNNCMADQDPKMPGWINKTPGLKKSIIDEATTLVMPDVSKASLNKARQSIKAAFKTVYNSRGKESSSAKIIRESSSFRYAQH
jgi:hypothetical protein